MIENDKYKFRPFTEVIARFKRSLNKQKCPTCGR